MASGMSKVNVKNACGKKNYLLHKISCSFLMKSKIIGQSYA